MTSIRIIGCALRFGALALLAATVAIQINVHRQQMQVRALLAELNASYPPKCRQGMTIEPGQSCMIIITIPKLPESQHGGI